MNDASAWQKITAANPDHSTWYIERFRAMAASGADLVGEARFIDAMVPRGARILDAGCGPGRHGGYLAQAGHDVVGVDVDPVLIAAAEEDFPGPTWLVGDLAELDLPTRGITEGFDAILCAGNVMAFLAPSTRARCCAAWPLTSSPRDAPRSASARVAATSSVTSSTTRAPAVSNQTCCSPPGTCAHSRRAPASWSRCCAEPERRPEQQNREATHRLLSRAA